MKSCYEETYTENQYCLNIGNLSGQIKTGMSKIKEELT